MPGELAEPIVRCKGHTRLPVQSQKGPCSLGLPSTDPGGGERAAEVLRMDVTASTVESSM